MFYRINLRRRLDLILAGGLTLREFVRRFVRMQNGLSLVGVGF